MPHILKNDHLTIHINSPNENYNFSRFDWTGKIANVRFKGISLAGTESIKNQNELTSGKGFYNEFGIDTALGFDDAKTGEWFHKIGIGLLKKKGKKYGFDKKYQLKPASFKVEKVPNKLIITCQSAIVNGYGYILKKTIELQHNGFIIHYYLENTGNKAIITDEYVHNFIAINKAAISTHYQLKFPFQLQPTLFEETVNPEQKVIVGQKDFKFNATPTTPFFFSNLSGNIPIKAAWELINLEHKIGIRETGDFETDKVNLWGCGHVISPELFHKLNIPPSQAKKWSRRYDIFEI